MDWLANGVQVVFQACPNRAVSYWLWGQRDDKLPARENCSIVKFALSGNWACSSIHLFSVGPARALIGRVLKTARLSAADQGRCSVATIWVSYESTAPLVENFPACSLWFDEISEPLILTNPKDATFTIPDETFFGSGGTRILFRIGFGKRSVRALARVRQPKTIKLNLVKANRLVGTIHRERTASVGAAAVEEGCDVTCVPPARQEAGLGRCVTCTDEDGSFELCC